MSATQRLLCYFKPNFSSLSPKNRLISNSIFTSSMPNRQGETGRKGSSWKEKPKLENPSLITNNEINTNRIANLSIAEQSGDSNVPSSSIQFGSAPVVNPVTGNVQKPVWKPKVTNVSGVATVSGLSSGVEANPVAENSSAGLSGMFKGPIGADFNVDKHTYALAKVRATFYPKFENEKSDQEVRSRMIELVHKGLATVEVSLKHSGSLFMYAGHEGGAYAKNSFGNVYTAVGVFVLGKMFREAWGSKAFQKQADFNDFLESNHMCIAMELVTAVLGDHGQRPQEDYVVVTAVTELGNGKPKFYSTPDIIAFCRKWRLPTNHVWLFSTRKSVTSFFASYDALCEEGIATTVCDALNEVADISVPGSVDHVKMQGEILEGLVARVVSCESSKHMEEVLKFFPSLSTEGVEQDMGPSLREICAANRSDEKEQIRVLLKSVGTSFCPDYSEWLGTGSGDAHSRNVDRSVVSKFIQAHPADYSTTKFQEVVRLMREKRFPAAFKSYHNFHKTPALSSDDLHFKMVVHVHSDSGFRRYQKEMRQNPGLWPLYRGFFVDINLFRANMERAAKFAKDSSELVKNVHCSSRTSKSGTEGLADEDANLMIKLKFLIYKIRTFLIRNGLLTLFKDGPADYKVYYLRQMKIWGTSPGKQKELSKMLDEWAAYILKKCGNKRLSSSIYLSEAEYFLEQYAKRSPENQALIGSAGNVVRAEDFIAFFNGGRGEEGDLDTERDITPSSPGSAVRDSVPKKDGLIIFFPGIPGCAKSALCKEILSASGGLGDDRPIHSLMGDLIKGRYWQKISEDRRKKPYGITLADKNAPNEEVWRQIEDMCRTTRASAVPVVPDSEGTTSNPFSIDALAIFMFRVLQRVNHPGNLDKSSPNAGYVLLMFYHLYEGKNHREFENDLVERFGSIVKMPLLKADRSPLPDPVKSILEEGINLYKLHTISHGRLDSTKGSYTKDWAKWEKQLREILYGNSEYLNTVQVTFDFAVKQVLEQLKIVAKGDYATPSSEKRKFGNIVFAAVTLPVKDVKNLLDSLAQKNPKVEGLLKDKDMQNSLKKAHVTLAHKRSHGVPAVASYGAYLQRDVPVGLTALLFSDQSAAFEASVGSVDGEKISSKNQWPHTTIWTGPGVGQREANALPQLYSEGKATRVDINPPVTISGTLEFY